MTLPHVDAITFARNQSKEGPPYKEGFCLGATTRAFFGHASGVDTAAMCWDANKHNHPFRRGGNMHDFLARVPRGFPLWFAGGTPTKNHPEGDGHVVISAVPFFCWGVDRLRTGYFGRTPVSAILTWNQTHPLRLLGWSEDINGFMVPYEPGSKDRK